MVDTTPSGTQDTSDTSFAQEVGDDRLTRSVAWLERSVAIVVVFLLFLTALFIIFQSAQHLLESVTNPAEASLTNVLSEILLALMVAEIIATVNTFLKRGVFDSVPFLVVGIIASIRRLLVISAESAEYFTNNSMIPVTVLIELGILIVAVGVFSWSITQLRRYKV